MAATPPPPPSPRGFWCGEHLTVEVRLAESGGLVLSSSSKATLQERLGTGWGPPALQLCTASYRLSVEPSCPSTHTHGMRSCPPVYWQITICVENPKSPGGQYRRYSDPAWISRVPARFGRPVAPVAALYWLISSNVDFIPHQLLPQAPAALKGRAITTHSKTSASLSILPGRLFPIWNFMWPITTSTLSVHVNNCHCKDKKGMFQRTRVVNLQSSTLTPAERL